LSSAPFMQPLIATSWGVLRRPLTAERLLLDLNSGKMRAIAVASLPHFNGLFARALARSLEEDALRKGLPHRFFALDIEYGQRLSDLWMGVHEALPSGEGLQLALDRLALAIRRAIAELPWDAILLPPILDCSVDAAELTKLAGIQIGEFEAPFSKQSERLASKLARAFDQIDPKRVRKQVIAIEEGPHAVLVETGEEHLLGRTVVLCIGRMSGGVADSLRKQLGIAGAVPVDERSRCVLRGKVSARIFAGGSAAMGVDPARGASFTSVAISGWIAGLEAVAAI
ncbi:MAG: hypothetical protein N2515_06830, partial [Deltaproteobacteria bacterium]|nr:hypothetical protein [Deltaproteobacteria bacterium]